MTDQDDRRSFTQAEWDECCEWQQRAMRLISYGDWKGDVSSYALMLAVRHYRDKLRDEFARDALRGLLANENTNPSTASLNARGAYVHAEAMLVARKKALNPDDAGVEVAEDD